MGNGAHTSPGARAPGGAASLSTAPALGASTGADVTTELGDADGMSAPAKADGMSAPAKADGMSTGAATMVRSTSGGTLTSRALTRSRGLGGWILAGHWLGRWYSEQAVRFLRYSAGSAVAYVVSGVVVFACSYWLHITAGTSAALAFVAGAIPNWVLNRRWAWQRRDRQGIAKETVLYVAVTAASFVLTVAAQHFAGTTLKHVQVSEIVRGGLLSLTFYLVTAVLWVLKYIAYDRLVFTGHRVPPSQAFTSTAPRGRP